MQKLRKLVTALVLIILLSGLPILITGCMGWLPGEEERRPEAEENGEQNNAKIGISLAKGENDRAEAITGAFEEREDNEDEEDGEEDGEENDEEEKEFEVIVKDANRDALQQTIDVEELINEEVEVIIIDMVDPSQGERLVNRIQERDIKVIAIYNLPENAPVDAYITPDNQQTGEMQGQYVMEQVQQGKVLILQGDPKSPEAQEITAGNLAVLQQNPELQVEVIEHREWRAEEVEPNLSEALIESSNQIRAIIANNSELIMAATDLLQERNLPERVITVGADAGQEAIESIVNDEHDAEIDSRPDMVGEFAVQAAQKLSEGEKWAEFDHKINNGVYEVPVKVIPVRLIDKENVDLVEERLDEIEGEDEDENRGVEFVDEEDGEENQEESEGENGENQEGQAEGDEQQGSRVMIRTHDGQMLEFELNGQDIEIDIEGRLTRVETTEQEGEDEEGDADGT